MKISTYKPEKLQFMKLVFTKGFFINSLIDGRPQVMKISTYKPEKLQFTKISRIRKFVVLQ